MLIANKVDREYWSAQLGVYFICAQAYDALSSSIEVSEGRFEGKLTGEFAKVYNFFLQPAQSQQFEFT